MPFLVSPDHHHLDFQEQETFVGRGLTSVMACLVRRKVTRLLCIGRTKTRYLVSKLYSLANKLIIQAIFVLR